MLHSNRICCMIFLKYLSKVFPIHDFAVFSNPCIPVQCPAHSPPAVIRVDVCPPPLFCNNGPTILTDTIIRSVDSPVILVVISVHRKISLYQPLFVSLDAGHLIFPCTKTLRFLCPGYVHDLFSAYWASSFCVMLRFSRQFYLANTGRAVSFC